MNTNNFSYTVKVSDTYSQLVEVFTISANNIREVISVISKNSKFNKPRLVYVKRK
jgi:hypothetical protein